MSIVGAGISRMLTDCTQAMRHKDDAGGWGPDEDVFPIGMGGSHSWAEDAAYM